MNEIKKTKTIAYLGPKGSYSESAAKQVAADGDILLPLKPIEEVVESFLSEAADICILPHYNSITGPVQPHLDLAFLNNLHIVGAKKVQIELCIGGYPGNEEYSEIYSHQKAFQQCTKYIRSNYPKSQTVEVASTSEAADTVRRKKSGLAIASIDALTNGEPLEVIARDIGNVPVAKNYTRFFVVSRDEADELPDNRKPYLTMIAVTPHIDRIGLLSDILLQIRYHGINMIDIHSRPALDEVCLNNNGEPKMFYIELAGHRTSENFIRAMEIIRWGLTPEGEHPEIVRVLGSYEDVCREIRK